MTIGALVPHASEQRNAVLGSGGQQRVIQLTDFVDAGDSVATGAQLGRQGDLVPNGQRVNIAEVAVHATVMTSDTDIAGPDGGVGEVAGTFGENGAGGILIDLHIYAQAGDFQGSQIAAAVIKPGSHISKAR